MQLELSMPIPPTLNNYLFPDTYIRNGKPFSRMVETPDVIQYKGPAIKKVKDEIIEQNWKMPPEGKMVDVFIDFYFPRKGMDPNNYLKVLLDVFTFSKVYFDDQYAKPITGLVIIDKFNPRLEITIVESPQIGVFENENKRKAFISEYENKIPTKKFNSILKKLDENRLTEETYIDGDYNVKIMGEM